MNVFNPERYRTEHIKLTCRCSTCNRRVDLRRGTIALKPDCAVHKVLCGHDADHLDDLVYDDLRKRGLLDETDENLYHEHHLTTSGRYTHEAYYLVCDDCLAALLQGEHETT